ncbi:MAG: hypothetical protein J6Z30_00350 [Pyramidobacter sp.]|nr:hypothetical protein [Pyramidobacter sp.]
MDDRIRIYQTIAVNLTFCFVLVCDMLAGQGSASVFLLYLVWSVFNLYESYSRGRNKFLLIALGVELLAAVLTAGVLVARCL